MSENKLRAPEFSNLIEKVNNNCVAVDYFRKSLFNATIKDSFDLKRKKIIFQSEKQIIKVDRSLNQRHRDLFITLMYEEKSDVSPDGSFFIKTSLYKLSKLLYPNSKNAKHRVKELLDDMRKTLIYIKQDNKELSHSLLARSYYDENKDTYIIQVTPETAKYLIYSYAMSIPQELNKKIVHINNAQLKALISYMLSNKKLENGIFFDTVCVKLDIKNTNKNKAKSKFKRVVKENTELLSEFGILYEDDKFLLEKNIVKFYHALSDKELKNYTINQHKKSLKNQTLQYFVNKDVFINDIKYKIIRIEKELDIKKSNYNGFNVYLEKNNVLNIMRTEVGEEETLVNILNNYSLHNE